MPDDKSKRGSPDNKRLNKSEPYEVAYAKSKRAGAARTKSASKTSKSGASRNQQHGQAGVEVGSAGDEAGQHGAAPQARRGAGAWHAESAQGREDGREHGAARPCARPTPSTC